MPGKKLSHDKLSALKTAIQVQLNENPKITAMRLFELVSSDPFFGGEISLGMVQNHLGTLRKGPSGKRKKQVEPEDKLPVVARRTRLSIDKRVQAVHLALKDTEKKRQAYERGMAELLMAEAELRDALRRALGTRAENLMVHSGDSFVQLQGEGETSV